MDAIEKTHNNINFGNSKYHYKGPTANVNFSNFIDAATLFGEIQSSRINLADEEKNQMDFKSKLSDIRIGGRKSEKQNNEIKNILNLSDTQEGVIKSYKDFFYNDA